MNPLYRVQMNCLLRGVGLFWSLASILISILVIGQLLRFESYVPLSFFIVIPFLFLAPSAVRTIPLQTEFMAGLAPLGGRRRIRARLMFAVTTAVFMGTLAGVASIPLALSLALLIHVANFSLTFLIGILGGDLLESSPARVPSYARLPLLIFVSLPYGGLGILQCVSPGLPWLWMVLLVILIPLLSGYLDFLKGVEGVKSTTTSRPGPTKTKKRTAAGKCSVKKSSPRRPAPPPGGAGRVSCSQK